MKLKGEVKMLKVIKWQKGEISSTKSSIQNAISEELESEACTQLVKAEKDIATLKQQIDHLIGRRIHVEQQLEYLATPLMPISMPLEKV